MLLLLLQVGVVLQAPNNLPLDVLPADGCVEMACSVPAAADTAEVGVAKQTVLATAQHLQVGWDARPSSSAVGECASNGQLERVCCWQHLKQVIA